MVVGFIFGMLRCGMGLHADTVPPDNIVLMAKLLLIAEILYAFNLVWTKISLLLMYYRIFHFPYFKRWAYIISTFVILWVICITFLFIFICVPVQKLWYPQLPGHCINQVSTWIANATSTILSDLATLILPIPQVWKLRLPTNEKVVITFAFSLGSLYVLSTPLKQERKLTTKHSVIVASAYRLKVLFSYSSSDPTYTLARTVGWTAIEMSAGIVSACLPTLKPALQFFVRKLGIKGSAFDLFPSEQSKTRTNHNDDQVTANILGRGVGQSGSQGSFYHLQDGTRMPVNDKLRPDEHGYEYTVSSVPRDTEGVGYLSSDEVPLHNIHVKRGFRQEISISLNEQHPHGEY